ncbi:hypothetical protein OKW49_007532 [Paraburkholderia youngii]
MIIQESFINRPVQRFLPGSLAQYAQVAFVNNKGNNNHGLNISDGATTLFAPSVTTVGVNTGIRTLF